MIIMLKKQTNNTNPRIREKKKSFSFYLATKVTSLIDYLIHHSRLIKHIMMVQYMQKKRQLNLSLLLNLTNKNQYNILLLAYTNTRIVFFVCVLFNDLTTTFL